MMSCSTHLETNSPHSMSGKQLSVTMPTVALMDSRHPHRQDVEKLVQDVFLDAYGARLTSFYPYLLAIWDADGGYQAVAGLRPGNHHLFCEHYLGDSPENLLGVPRENMVEIGNLASVGPGRIRWIIMALTAFLQGAEFTQVLFTITPLLRNSFSRMGLPLKQLASARAECLPPGLAQNWGAYYDCSPAVYAGYIPVGYEALSMAVRSNALLENIWSRAFAAGREASHLLKGNGA